MPVVAFDTETTGLSPFGGDRIIEFAAVTLHLGEDGRVSDIESYSCLINPGMPIPRVTREITGITDADVVDAPSFGEVADNIRKLLQDAVTVAHNYAFDHAFLSEEYRRIEQGWPEPLAEVDTVDVSLRCFPDQRGHKLIDVCNRLDIRLEGAHRATNDAEACGRCFVELARRHQVADDLQTMLDWAHAIGRPPADSVLEMDPEGHVVFGTGPYAGNPIAAHPIHLAWMLKARELGPSGWTYRFTEKTRGWIKRWLDVRGAGRAKQNAKPSRPDSWMLDPCIATPSQDDTRQQPQLDGV